MDSGYLTFLILLLLFFIVVLIVGIQEYRDKRCKKIFLRKNMAYPQWWDRTNNCGE